MHGMEHGKERLLNRPAYYPSMPKWFLTNFAKHKPKEQGLPVELLLLLPFDCSNVPLKDLPLLASTGRNYRKLMQN